MKKDNNFVDFLHEKQLVNTCIQVINLEYKNERYKALILRRDEYAVK